MVDALTDIIRPFTEARGLKADRIRVQREEVAIEIAKRARAKLAVQRAAVQPVPTKILVPLLEHGSTEAPDDEFMLDKWAELLASATRHAVEPRFVHILAELTTSQAQMLEELATGELGKRIDPNLDTVFGLSPWTG